MGLAFRQVAPASSQQDHCEQLGGLSAWVAPCRADANAAWVVSRRHAVLPLNATSYEVSVSAATKHQQSEPWDHSQHGATPLLLYWYTRLNVDFFCVYLIKSMDTWMSLSTAIVGLLTEVENNYQLHRTRMQESIICYNGWEEGSFWAVPLLRNCCILDASATVRLLHYCSVLCPYKATWQNVTLYN